MKRMLQVIIAVLLLLSMLLVMTSCFKPIETPDPPGNNNNNNNNDDDDDDDDDENPYADLFAQILSRITSVNSLEGYLDLISYLYDTLPADKLSAAVETLAGAQYGDMVEEYYAKGEEILAMANIAVPFLPYLNKIGLIRDLLEAEGNPFLKAAAEAALNLAGVTINKGEESTTYSYTYQQVTYVITVNGNIYTVSFSGNVITIVTFEDNENLYDITFTEGETTRNILFEYAENLYKVTESGIFYEVEFDEDDKTFAFSGTDISGELDVTKYLFESVITDDSDLAIQFYQAEGGWLIQLLTDIANYKATLSLQTEATTEPDTIISGIDATFATEGQIFTIDETTLGALLPN